MNAYAECTLLNQLAIPNLIYTSPQGDCIEVNRADSNWQSIDEHIFFRAGEPLENRIEMFIFNITQEHSGLMITCIPTIVTMEGEQPTSYPGCTINSSIQIYVPRKFS